MIKKWNNFNESELSKIDDKIKKSKNEKIEKEQRINYINSQIESILEPETKYGYKICITNSGEGGKKSNWLSVTKEQLLNIKKILAQ